MATSQANPLQEALAKIKSDNFAEIIDKVVGERDNLKVDVVAVRFFMGKVTYEVNGEINFNVKHKNNRHWKDTDDAVAPK